jgi:DNA-binding phage protein
VTTRPPLRRVRIFEPQDVISLLRSEIERTGDQGAWARNAGLDRTAINKVLKGHKPLTPSIIRALGLRIAIVSDEGRRESPDVSRVWFSGQS